MNPVAQKTLSLVGGGRIFGWTALDVLVEGMPIAVLGDMVTPHGACPEIPIHCAATLVQSSQNVLATGIPVCRVSDTASCGDRIAQTGTRDVLAG